MIPTVDIILIIGVCTALIRYAILNSKCSDISLCFGLINIKRDTKAELELQETELERGLDINGTTPQQS